jgi:hypothetical protein
MPDTLRVVGSTLNFLMDSSAAWHIMFAATANNAGLGSLHTATRESVIADSFLL